jgi:hypothetical protein
MAPCSMITFTKIDVIAVNDKNAIKEFIWYCFGY